LMVAWLIFFPHDSIGKQTIRKQFAPHIKSRRA